METATTNSPLADALRADMEALRVNPRQTGLFFAHKYNQTVACCEFMGILATTNNPLVHF